VISNVAGILNSCGFNDNVAATSGRISNPYQVTVDQAGGIYIADYNNDRVRYIPATGPNAGVITTIAGGASSTGTPAQRATLLGPTGVAVDPATGDVYIAAKDEHRIYRVTSAGAINVVAGTGTAGFNGDQLNATAAQLNNPYMLTISGSYLYVGDSSNNRI